MGLVIEDFQTYLENFALNDNDTLFGDNGNSSDGEYFEIDGRKYPKYINEFWTSKQRQANSLHEVSYRACFKPQLPRFFINALTSKGDTVYDPFAGRGTTAIEAALLDRIPVANDINPLSVVFTEPRLAPPRLTDIKDRLNEIQFDYTLEAEIDLSMFYHTKTEAEIVSLKKYLDVRKERGGEDEIDKWIRMVATNRLTGHSKNFFSVYTLPPNQATTQERQKKINEKRNQKPEYKNVKKIIFSKSASLLKDITLKLGDRLHALKNRAVLLNKDSRDTSEIERGSIDLIVTSPPFLDVVQYVGDNWLRCWFNGIDSEDINSKITVSKKVAAWSDVMNGTFKEFSRIVKKNAFVAFEVGEVRKGKVLLDEIVVPIGLANGFDCECIIINRQNFTKTSNIWGVNNNQKGTNTNRIVLFRKI